MTLDAIQVDRAVGALLGLAAGDALGAPYEFTSSPDPSDELVGGGGFGWAPGEWTDDTQMAICVAEVTATGVVDAEAIGQRFLEWFHGRPKDVGISTTSVLSSAVTAAGLPDAARRYLEQHPRGAAGNGSLMRTAPVALAHLGDDDAIADASREVSSLTHGDPLTAEACVLWGIAIDRAVRQGRFDGVRDGLDLLSAASRDRWDERLAQAESQPAASFTRNGFVVTALQAAYASILHTPILDEAPSRHLQDALMTAVRVGGDTDTVAAIAGQVLGARWGQSAIPFRWRRRLHGWPGYRARDLVRLAVLTARGGESDNAGWPAADDLRPYYAEADPHDPVAVALPDDPGLLVGNVAGVSEADVDFVVSLCRMGGRQIATGVEHVEIPLIDSPTGNAQLRQLVADLVDGICELRDEGRRVYLHCVRAHSRTPTVAAAYLARRLGISGPDALERVLRVLPTARPNAAFRALIDEL